jgi:hypothetical protein
MTGGQQLTQQCGLQEWQLQQLTRPLRNVLGVAVVVTLVLKYELGGGTAGPTATGSMCVCSC